MSCSTLAVPAPRPPSCWEGAGCVQRGMERVGAGLGSLVPAPVGCAAALSRPPSCTLHFSVWHETGAVIHLTRALQAGDAARLAPAAGVAGAPAPCPPQHPPGSSAAPRTEPVLSETSPSPRLDVWCWAPACRGISQGFCLCLAEAAVLLCFVCSQSVSFVSVFEKKIRSLPPRSQPRYQPGHATAIVSLSNLSAAENSQSGTCRRAAIAFTIAFARASLLWGGRAEDGAFSCIPACQLILG